MSESLLMSVTEACEALGCSRSYLYRLIKANRIPYMKLGRLTKIPRHGLSQFIEMNMEVNYQ